MPDWSYRTLFRPLLSRLPPRAARKLTLRGMGAVSRMPGGTLLIKTLGHMEPSPLLERRMGNLVLGTPVGLGSEVDPDGLAQRALAQLGFGFAWVGPVLADGASTEPATDDARTAMNAHAAQEAGYAAVPAPTYEQAGHAAGSAQTLRSAGRSAADRVSMDHVRETILYPDGPECVSVNAAVRSIRDAGRYVPVFVRIAPSPEAAPEQAAQQLAAVMQKLDAEGAAGFAVDAMSLWRERPWSLDDYATLIDRAARASMETIATAAATTMTAEVTAEPVCTADRKPLLWHIPADCSADMAEALVSALCRAGWSGVVVGPGCGDEDASAGGIHCPIAAGPDQLAPALRLIRRIRGQAGASFILQAAAGIHEPIDALRAQDAGADHIVLNSGFVYAGPGLPKRINDAIIYEQVKRSPSTAAYDARQQPLSDSERTTIIPAERAITSESERGTATGRKAPSLASAAPEPSFWRHWGWMCLLGIGMMAGGLIAWMIAVTTVLLPYDEDFLGMTWRQVRDLHPHLLHFMSHDRITLAGTMISIGILYYMLARHGMRHGQHWARIAVLVSCLIGFPSFFLYLGYGYFDPLHAGAAIILLPMFLLSMRRNPDRPSREPVNLRNDRLWRQAVWGQLCFVALGIALAVGGLTIAGVGITRVFVPSDLAYLNLSPEQMDAINPRLIPLIAHDRAGFGGALLADAAALLATALWGIQQGARWLWATLLLGGAPAFYAAISVHFNIGYVDTIHLLPAYFALFLYVAGLILLYPYMMSKPEPYVPESGTASA